MKIQILTALFFVSSMTVSTTGIASTLGIPTPDEMAANFRICDQSVDWHRNWGQYVVSFDIDQARELCNKDYGQNSFYPKRTACSHDGNWILAGYYCEVAPSN